MDNPHLVCNAGTASLPGNRLAASARAGSGKDFDGRQVRQAQDAFAPSHNSQLAGLRNTGSVRSVDDLSCAGALAGLRSRVPLPWHSPTEIRGGCVSPASPQALRLRVIHTPGQEASLRQSGTSQGSARPVAPGALEQQRWRAVHHGYAKAVTEDVHPATARADSDRRFTQVVAAFNEAMEGFHRRFPSLRELDPPRLALKGAPGVPSQCQHPHYEPRLSAITFPVSVRLQTAPRICAHEVLTKDAGPASMLDVIAHQYAHHLIAKAIVPAANWRPALGDIVLRNDRMWTFLCSTDRENPDFGHYPSRVAKLCMNVYFQLYPDRHLAELAAEVIAWKLHPQYGACDDAPTLPRCLDIWMRECFPFLIRPRSPIPPEPPGLDAQGKDGSTRIVLVATVRAPHKREPPTRTTEPSRERTTHHKPLVSLRSARNRADRVHRNATISFDCDTLAFVQSNSNTLASEMRNAVIDGLASGMVLPGNRFCRHPVTDGRFQHLVADYNEAMMDLHTRFPGLKRVNQPYLSNSDPAADRTRCSAGEPPSLGTYRRFASILEMRQFTDSSQWIQRRVGDGTQYSAPGIGFAGVLAHEYGHHLSSEAVVSGAIWAPALKAMLEANLPAAEAAGAASAKAPPHEAFRARYGRLIGTMGIGHYAGQDALEFAAEAIAWRLHPHYGGRSEAPRMPRYVEDWVHECFPFLNNGRIPEPCVEVNPDALQVLVQRGDEVIWVPRNELYGKPPASGH